MGNYRAQYEKYYNNITKNPRYDRSKLVNNNNKYNKEGPSDKSNNRIAKQVIGAIVLIGALKILGTIKVEGAQGIYVSTKDIVSSNLEIVETMASVEDGSMISIKEKTIDTIDKVKVKLIGGKTLKEVIKDEYILPISDCEYSNLADNKEGILIRSTEILDVHSSYDGIVTSVDKLSDGYHVVIKHNNGVETYYGLLSEVVISEGDKVEKSEVIGKNSNIDDNNYGVVFKIIYMGIEKNPISLMSC